jgi:antitoxin component YwqK of YwqJK toxin-antitoxin module
MFTKFLFSVFLFIASCGNLLKAQYIKSGEYGKTFYDSNYTQVCEIFHHNLHYVLVNDSARNEKILKGIWIIKNGPYLSYYQNGMLESSGFYIDNEKDSIWLQYSPEGKLIKTEKYKNNIQIE